MSDKWRTAFDAFPAPTFNNKTKTGRTLKWFRPHDPDALAKQLKAAIVQHKLDATVQVKVMHVKTLQGLTTDVNVYVHIKEQDKQNSFLI